MSDLHQELKSFLIEAMNLEDMTPADIDNNAPLFSDDGLGLDSIDALELVLAIKKTYGIALEANDEQTRQHLRSILTLAAMIESHRTQAD